MMNFLKQMSLLHNIHGHSALDTQRLIDVLEGISAPFFMLDHANVVIFPLPDNATKLKMAQIQSTFKVGTGGTPAHKCDGSTVCPHPPTHRDGTCHSWAA